MASIPVSDALVEFLVDAELLKEWDADDNAAVDRAIIDLHSRLMMATVTRDVFR